jgi:hypothetical protein
MLALLLALVSGSQAQQAIAPLEPQEYSVMGVMLDGFQKDGLASHPFVADRTSTFECSAGCNGLAMAGCNGLRSNGETPKERLAIVKRDLPAVEQTTLSDFEFKNKHCSEIANKIPSRSSYFLFGSDHVEKLPSGWEHPDFFYFSRVGFNEHRTQALVHVSFMSGTNGADSGGKYFLLMKQNGKWEPKASSDVWQLTSRCCECRSAAVTFSFFPLTINAPNLLHYSCV